MNFEAGKPATMEDTIAAVSTPPGTGGIAVLRVSGPDAVSIVRKTMKIKGKKNFLKERQAVHCWIMDREESLDEAIVLYFKAPGSYTGEDVVEIHCHGGAFVSRRILDLFIRLGARPANPGEFTYRAYLNGRMDLAQAEAVADLIQSQTEASRRVAVYQLEGRLSKRIEKLRESLIRYSALLEIELDFSEEELEFASRGSMKQDMKQSIDEMEDLLASYDRGRICREGVRMAITGRPNVGKSSILNCILEKERAIVADAPGTTRDTIEDVLDINGLLFVVTDMAGIHKTSDPVEMEGVRRAKIALEQADLVLLVLDSSQSLHRDDITLFEEMKVKNKKIIAVLNKKDLPQSLTLEEAQLKLAGTECLEVSALKKQGIPELIKRIHQIVLSEGIPQKGEVVITSARHHACLQRAHRCLQKANTSLRKGMSQEFVAMDMRGALDALGEMTGQTPVEDILERIFSSFCIGK